MDGDIQFGDLEETQPDSQLRPDQDMHYAVVPCYQPREGELPVYVDIDAMRDIESHAQTDVSVELGGVLLGGQYEDDDGQPFVVVHDCLRAEHYEATKGSFKFTHETWEAITRQRENFAEEVEMVGWYHTHPDWGVFLSGMDMFICDNFFNRPLDVALVVDPCRGDHGWFQWTGNPSERVKRTGGFFLIGSRFRQQEIEQFSAYLEQESGMSAHSQYRPVAGQVGPTYPVINMPENNNPILNYALLGMLAIQFLFCAMIGWSLLSANAEATQEADQASLEATAKMSDRIDELEAREYGSLRAEVQSEMLQTLALRLAGEAPELNQALEESRVDNRQLSAALDGQIQLTSQLQTSNQRLQASLATSNEKRTELDQSVKRYKSEKEDLLKQIEELEEGGTPYYQDWRVLLAGGVLMALSLGCGFAVGFNMRGQEDEPDLRTRPEFSTSSFAEDSPHENYAGSNENDIDRNPTAGDSTNSQD